MRKYFDKKEDGVFFCIKRIGGIHNFKNCSMPP